MNTANQNRFDTVLTDLTQAGAAAVSDVDKQLQLVRLQAELEEKRQQREEANRAASERSQARSQMITAAIAAFGPVVAAMLSKPAIAPELLAIITANNKGGNMEEVKALLDMQRDNAKAQVDALKDGFFSIIKTKDEMSKMILESALEARDNEGEGGIMGWITDITKAALPALLERKPEAAPPALPNPAPAPQAPQQARPSPGKVPPVVLVLKMMEQYKLGTFATKEARRIIKANMTAVILQDPKLSELLNLADQTGQDPVLEYCKPFVARDPGLVAFMLQPENQEWVVNFIEEELIDRIQAEMEDDEEVVVGDGHQQQTQA